MELPYGPLLVSWLSLSNVLILIFPSPVNNFVPERIKVFLNFITSYCVRTGSPPKEPGQQPKTFLFRRDYH